MYRILTFSILIFIFVSSFFLLNKNSLQAAPWGNYLIFQGGYIKAQNPSPNIPPAFSFEVWIKPLFVSNKRQILTIGDNKGGQKYYQVGINGGSLSLYYIFNNSSLRLMTAGQLTENQWQHVGVTISENATRLYINGQIVSSAGGALNLKELGSDIIVGSNIPSGTTGSQNYYGEMDLLRISRTERNIGQNWQNNIYQTGLAADSETLILWNFDQSRGETEVNDSSVSSISGFLQGGDAKIHFFGVLPTPTRFFQYILPTLPTLRRISWPSPIEENPQPTKTFEFDYFRGDRPQLPR